jgi:hypothetical protein
MTFRVVVLGGYGCFGARIARWLADDEGIDIVVAGRDATRAADTAAAISLAGGRRVDAAALDVAARDVAQRLRALEPALVIDATGPFQERDYGAARAAISVGAHYIDLADARRFVCGVRAIDDAARSRDRLVVSGASTVPGLTSAVVDAFAHEFDALASIDAGIAPGNRIAPGSATFAAVAAGLGQRFGVWRGSVWQPAHGWQRLRRHRYPMIAGGRWLADFDAPDLELFPERYPGVNSVEFGAGLELPPLHLGLWLLSWPVRWGWLRSLARQADRLRRIAGAFARHGSDTGAMHVTMEGYRRARKLSVTWSLVARGGDGPQVPCTAAVVLARKLAAGTLAARGAMPCLGLFSLDECVRALADFDVRTTIERTLA